MTTPEQFADAVTKAFGEHWKIARRPHGFTAGIDLSTSGDPDIVTIAVTVKGATFAFSSQHLGPGSQRSKKAIATRERELVRIGKTLGLTVDLGESEPAVPRKTPRQIFIIALVVVAVLCVGVLLFMVGLSAGVRGGF